MTGSSEPQTISLLSLADRFKETERMMPNRAFAFVLGAGASRSSGIKGAAQMVDDWIPLLYREVVGNADGDAKAWATAQTLGIAYYDPADPAAAYSELYRRMYARDPDRGYAYLEEQMRNAEPSYGYSVLARIMETTRHKVVVTTNFDNLVADSLSIFSKTYPLVCGHESLAGFISARVRRPLVVKVHRDLLLAPKSTPEDLGALPDGFSSALADIFRHYTPIVIGYGGNDGSLMKFLKDLPPRSVPGGVYWCHWDEGEPPSDEIQHFVAAQQGALVPIPGFDEAMMLLGEALEFDVPDKFVLDRAQARAKRIVEQVQALQTRLKSRTHRLPALADAEVSASDVLTSAVEKTMQRTSGTLRWWQWELRARDAIDIDERDRIYREAIAALPESSELLGIYANFLKDVRKDYDQAEAYYRKSLTVDPTHATTLGNYALFLHYARKDYDQADTYYAKTLAADPTGANTLGSYAHFLATVRKDYDQAEAYYSKALAADPMHVNNLNDYAYFLTTVRKDYEQAEMSYKKALVADPNDPIRLGNYASFLLSLGRTDEGLAILERGLSALGQLTLNAQHVETWMYATCHWLPERWHEALSKLKSLLLVDKISTGDWDFSGVIEAAKKRKHPAAEWLDPLAAVCSGTADASTLDGWEAWREA